MRLQNKAYNHRKSDWIIWYRSNKYQLNIIKTVNQYYNNNYYYKLDKVYIILSKNG